jgi:transcriptional regulator with XRE-family HTH domain
MPNTVGKKRGPKERNQLLREAFGKKLRAKRLEKLLSQRELGDLTGIDSVSISRIECGRGGVTIDHLEKLALALGCSMCRLLPSCNYSK